MKRTCNVCGETKPLDQFRKAKDKPGGHKMQCAACCRVTEAAYRERNRERIRTYSRGWHRTKDSAHWHKRVLYRHGLTPEYYLARLWHQKGVCAICELPDRGGRRLHVDHCHRTGVIRGLLCGPCNKMLGLALDQPDRLVRAAEYVEVAA